ncbi:MAG: replication-associated recombination protein A [Lacunisphaera sp.]
MDDLFSSAKKAHAPLAARMRPTSLAEVIGQPHLTGPGALLPKLIKRNQFGSLIFIGPPGCGKTSLAEAIAHETKTRIARINATTDGTKEVRQAIEQAKLYPDQVTILFVDELHRFNKAQQDQLLPAVEDGTVRLIGATTHNPAFYVIPPLLSRSQLFRLNPVKPEDLIALLERALVDEKKGLGSLKVKAEPAVLRSVAAYAGGDVRQALNSLEAIASVKEPGETITESDLASFARERNFRYDRDEDTHYDISSGIIKSIRGSDADAAIYWLKRMLAGGEDPRFIARRLVILASEDVGLADPRALPIAMAAAQAVDFVGLPEAEFALSHAALFLALSPKSNSITKAMGAAGEFLTKHPDLPVPEAIRDNHYKRPVYLGENTPESYKYSHDYPLNVSGQDYLPIPAQLVILKEGGDETRLLELAKRRDELKHLLRQKKP